MKGKRLWVFFQSISYFGCGHWSERLRCTRRCRCGDRFRVLRKKDQCIKRLRVIRIASNILDMFPRIDIRRRIGFCDPKDEDCSGKNLVRLRALVCQHALGMIRRTNRVTPAHSEMTREQIVEGGWTCLLCEELINLLGGR